MRTFILSTLLILVLIAIGPNALAKGDTGCAAKYAAITESATVSFQGTGDQEITVITDPLCWHCRLGHKLLGEYPQLYSKVHMAFFPRQSFIGSDMAAWILEDAVGTEDLKAKIDFAYTSLKQPKTSDLSVAREIVLSQFIVYFPEMMGRDEDIQDVADRLKKKHEKHVLETAALCRKAELPGTPVLIAGKYILMGYGAGPWIKVLQAPKTCE